MRAPALVVMALAVAGCTAREAPAAAAHPAPPWARANLAAVEGVPTNRSASMAVDPRPIAIPEGPAFPDPTSYYPDRDAGVRWLAGRLLEAGIDTARAFPIDPGCGSLVMPARYKRVDGCPSSPRVEYVFDIAEPEGDGSVWTVLMLGIYYVPEGRTVTLYRMVLEREGEVLRFLRAEPLIVFD